MTELIISLIGFLAFTLYVGIKYGVQKSISASVYLGKTELVLYSLFMAFIAIPIMIVSDCTLGWWAGAILLLDFAAVATRTDAWQMKIHMAGATIGIGLAMIMLVTFGLWWLVLAFFIPSLYLNVKNVKNYIWLIECLAMAVVWIGLFIVKVL